ncbi:MAG: alpha/beta hydrolase [Planctomycetota bacterium]
MTGTVRASWLTTLALIALLPSCALPLVSEVGRDEIDLARFPAGTERLACETEDAVTLRGVRVPAADARGVVLHLLPRDMSLTDGLRGLGGFRETLEALAAEGFASVVFDYRGVGASAGEVDATALEADARAMWRALDSRPDATAGTVILRGCSLGSLAASSILAEARPDAVVLAAPVDVDSLKGNALARELGGFLGAVASPFFRAPDLPTLSESLERFAGPTLVLLGEDDELLPPEDWPEALREPGPERRVATFPLDHESLAIRFYGFEYGEFSGRVAPSLLPAELEFLRALPR